jgi:hypothetical protein
MPPRSSPTSWLSALPYALIVAGAFLRIVPHLPNFAPVGAIALFGGGVLPLPWSLLVPVAAMGLSDAVLGFYPGMVWVYGSFLLIALLGRAALQPRRPVVRIAATALGASVLFFAVTNFGEWLGPLYPHTWDGLCAAYIAAIPFFRNTALSDIGYSLALFGLYEGARRLARRPIPHAVTSSHRTT